MAMSRVDGSTGELHVVVGAGAIGAGVAALLLAAGHRVRVVTRSGSGPQGVERVASDASDEAELCRLAQGAAAIYNCANPSSYHRWPIDWPPIARALLVAAESSGAVLATVSNLYGYGSAPAALGVPEYDDAHPMTEATPLAATGAKGAVRAQMWRDALAAHEAGRIRVTEVRASDYIGAVPGSSVVGRIAAACLSGKSVAVLGRADRPHTWSHTADVCRTMVAAARDPRAWGKAWHAPSNAPRTQRQLADDLARAAGVDGVRVNGTPSVLLRGAGLVSPLLRELRETEYQFRGAFVMDSSAATAVFGIAPTPWPAVVTETLRAIER